jgi:glucose/arabinose dehydrogenase
MFMLPPPIAVLRFAYHPATSQRIGSGERLIDLPGRGYNQHWTRGLAFSQNGETLFVSVGSQSNVSVERDSRRAAILAMNIDGSGMRVVASGLRNPSGLAIEPQSGALWTSVNERDNLGDDVPDDYVTRVIEGGFYGWPYAYAGRQVDNRVRRRPDLVAKSIAPDLTLGAHVAPLQVAFASGQALPEDYRHGAFIVEHGSWNRRRRVGYQVVFVPFEDGRPTGQPITFLSGFVPDPNRKEVYGRPSGVALGADGAVFVADDGGNVIWEVRPDR